MLVASNRQIQEQPMFSTPEIYLQAELRYHRDQIRATLGNGRLERQGKPVRRRASSRLVRRTTTAVSASR
jgi:hypothetical protein